MNKLDHLNSWHSDWTKTKVIVYGLGVTGFSAADTLVELGSQVLVVSDNADLQTIDVLNVLGVESIIGHEQSAIIERFRAFKPDLVITSPGVRPDNRIILEAIANEVPVWTDIDLAWRVRDKFGSSSEWVCITGTNGKTTVTQLVEQILLKSGLRAAACGNIGVPILDVVRDPANFQVLVVELSSFQLHYLQEIAPIVSTVLNLADDHLDWHGSFEEYSKAKGKIFHNTKVCCVYNAGDQNTQKLMEESLNTADAQAVGFTVNTPAPNEIGWVEDVLVDRAFVDDPSVALELATISDIAQIPLISPHLMANIAAASAVVRALEIQPEFVAAGLRSFKLDAHRIELILEKDGIAWVDDSKATNPHAAAAALATFDSVIWIVGGLLKGVDIAPLVKKYSARVKAAIVIGVERQPVLTALEEHAAQIPVFEIDDLGTQVMLEAVKAAKRLAQTGDTVLLAPAAASMDQFRDYAHRGELFAAAVTQEVS